MVLTTQLQSRIKGFVIVHVVASVINGLSTSTGYVFRIVVSYIAMYTKALVDNDGKV